MELLTLLLLIVLNAGLVLSEMAIVASRRTRLQHLADAGHPGSATALALANEPGHFLATTQIGITVIGIASGAFAAETVAKQLAALLAGIAMLAPYADRLALAVVVGTIALGSLVLGELVPKRVALLHAEVIASAIARPMRMLSRIAFPLVRATSAATDGVLRLFGAGRAAAAAVSQEEIEILMRQGAAAGVFDPSQEVMVARVFGLDERRVTSLMTPRADIFFLDLDRSFEANRATLAQGAHSHLPLVEGGLDTVVGIVAAKDLLDDALQGRPFDPARHAAKPVFVPDGLTLADVLASFRRQRNPLALVVDEYGEIQGLVTRADIVQALVGDMGEPDGAAGSDIVRREDGAWLVDGAVAVARLAEVPGLEEALPADDVEHYDTVGGFVLARLRRIPRAGDRFATARHFFEVIAMDQHRVRKVLISAARAPHP